MKSDELILLGRIIKSQGFDGALVIALESNFSEEIEDLESVFVEVDGIPVPFFVSLSSISGKLLTLRFEDYESKEKTAEFIGCNVFTESVLTSEVSSTSLPLFITGYKLYAADELFVGTIIKIASYPMQVMLVVEGVSGSEILVPFHQNWVINIDKKRMIVEMDLPEGIISVND